MCLICLDLLENPAQCDGCWQMLANSRAVSAKKIGSTEKRPLINRCSARTAPSRGALMQMESQSFPHCPHPQHSWPGCCSNALCARHFTSTDTGTFVPESPATVAFLCRPDGHILLSGLSRRLHVTLQYARPQLFQKGKPHAPCVHFVLTVHVVGSQCRICFELTLALPTMSHHMQGYDLGILCNHNLQFCTYEVNTTVSIHMCSFGTGYQIVGER